MGGIRLISHFFFISVFLIFLVWFIIPMFKGIVNIGNVSGSIGCLLAVAFIYFNKPIILLMKSAFKTSLGRMFILFIITFLILGILMVTIFSALMIKAILTTPNEPTTVIILGCKVKGTTPSLMLRNRLDGAVIYLNNNPQALCIVSGGQGENEDISEAEAMEIYLINQGISKNRIYRENKSINTHENLKFSKEILSSLDLGNDIAIVTDGFHQYRAGLIANKLSLNVTSISVKTKWYLVPTYWVREWFGLAEQIFL